MWIETLNKQWINSDHAKEIYVTDFLESEIKVNIRLDTDDSYTVADFTGKSSSPYECKRHAHVMLTLLMIAITEGVHKKISQALIDTMTNDAMDW